MNEKYNKMNYRRYNETNTRTNGTGIYQNDRKLNDRTDSAEFPSLRLYKIGTYVHKSFLEYPGIRKTDLIKRNIIWANSIYNLGRIMYPDLLPAAFRLNNLSYKPDVSNIVRSRKTSSFEADETLMEDATFMFPDAKDIGVALTICKRILKIPIRERTEDQIGRLEWAMEVLDVSDDMVRYLLKLIEQISKTESKRKYTNTTQVKEPTVAVKTVESINNKATNQNGANKAATTAASSATTSATKANSTGAKSTSKSSTVTKANIKSNSTSAKTTLTKENSTTASNAGNTSKVTKANSTPANSAGNTATVTKTNSTSANSAGNTSTATNMNSTSANSVGNTSTATNANSKSANSVGNTSTANKANSGNTSTATKTNSTSAKSVGNTSTVNNTNSTSVNTAGNTSAANKANSTTANSAGNTATVTKANSTSANFAGNTSTENEANSGNTSTATKTNSTSEKSVGNTSAANKANSTSANSAGNTSTADKANSGATSTVTKKSSTAATTASTSTVTEAKLVSESSTSTTTTTATKPNSTETISTTASSASTTTVTSVSSSTPNSKSTTSTATKANTVAASSTTATTFEAVTFTYINSTITTKNFAATSASIMSNLAKARAASSNVPKTAGSKKKKNAAQQIAPTPPISNKHTIPVLISSADTARFPKSTPPVLNEPKTGSNPHVLIGLNANAQKGNPRAPLMYNIPAVNRPYPAPMQPIRPPPRPQMNNFPQQTHPMYRPPAPYPVQAPMNNFQPRPYMYNHPPAPASYQPQPRPYMGPAMHQQYQMQHNYQEYYNYNNNAAAPNMPYPAMQQPNYYEPCTMSQPQPLAPPSAMESNHNFYDASAYNSTAANMPEPVPQPPPMTKSATRTTQNRPKERDKASRASTSKASSTTKQTIDTTPTSTKSFQTRKNIEDFVNPSNPLSNKLSKILSDSLPEYIINKQTIDLSAFGEESTFNAKRRRLIEEGLISVPEEPKEPIVVGLVDHNAPNGTISQANWSFIQNRLQTTLLELLKDDPGSFPNGLDAGWHQGRIKLFAFPNQRSLQLFKRAIYTLGDLWPGARITVEPQSSLPHRPRYRTYIPAAPSDPATILKIIQVSNPNLPTHDWEVVQVDNEKKKQRCACLVLNAESFEPLLEQGMIITYGFGCIRLKIFKQDKLPHEREALQDKNRGKLNQVTMSYRKRTALERDRAEIEREYRNSFGEKRMREDELTSKLAEDILQHLDQIMDESTFNVPDERAEYRDWY